MLTVPSSKKYDFENFIIHFDDNAKEFGFIKRLHGKEIHIIVIVTYDSTLDLIRYVYEIKDEKTNFVRAVTNIYSINILNRVMKQNGIK